MRTVLVEMTAGHYVTYTLTREEWRVLLPWLKGCDGSTATPGALHADEDATEYYLVDDIDPCNDRGRR